jgi:hypothetical protein
MMGRKGIRRGAFANLHCTLPEVQSLAITIKRKKIVKSKDAGADRIITF